MAPDDHMGEGAGNPNPAPTPHNRGWVSIAQLATLLERDYRTVRKWVDEKRVHAIKVGGQYRIMEEEVRYILEHGTREPTKDNGGTDA